MLKIETVADLKNTLAKKRLTPCKIGLVPTMGALHEGHLSLVKKSLSENDVTVTTIFVNPTQFNKSEDLKKYPKNLSQDFLLLENAGVDVVFAPAVEEMYQDGVTAQKYDFGTLTAHMEGKFRTGHFDGVATIVEKLFSLVGAENAYFGEKDFQQLQIVKKVALGFKKPPKIIGCETLREKNGLAMSSRNERLSKPLREKAGIIYQTLCDAREKFRGGDTPYKIKSFVKVSFAKTPFELEYFEMATADDLTRIENHFDPSKKIRGFIAVIAEGVRLIDNIGF